MNCTKCGYEHLRPYDVKGPIRFYKCWKCEHKFQTIEKLHHSEAHTMALEIFRRHKDRILEA